MSREYALSIVLIIVLFIVLVLLIVDAWYWWRVFSAASPIPVTNSEAGWLLAFNVILAIVVFVVWIVAIYYAVTANRTTTMAATTVVANRKTATVTTSSVAPIPTTPVAAGAPLYSLGWRNNIPWCPEIFSSSDFWSCPNPDTKKWRHAQKVYKLINSKMIIRINSRKHEYFDKVRTNNFHFPMEVKIK